MRFDLENKNVEKNVGKNYSHIKNLIVFMFRVVGGSVVEF